jgi:hypothetical protein
MVLVMVLLLLVLRMLLLLLVLVMVLLLLVLVMVLLLLVLVMVLLLLVLVMVLLLLLTCSRRTLQQRTVGSCWSIPGTRWCGGAWWQHGYSTPLRCPQYTLSCWEIKIRTGSGGLWQRRPGQGMIVM